MTQASIPAMAAPPRERDNPLTRSVAGIIGLIVLSVLVLASVGTLPWTLGKAGADAEPRFNDGSLSAFLLPPWWTRHTDEERERLNNTATERATSALEREPTPAEAAGFRPRFWLGTDNLGRDLMVRILAGGGVSIGIGIAAATISVFIGTLYGAIAGYCGGRIDAVMMRIVDVLYGLPYVLLVVLLAVAGDALFDSYIAQTGPRVRHVEQQAVAELRSRGEPATPADARQLIRDDAELRAHFEAQARDRFPPRVVSPGRRATFNVAVLLVAIGGVSWLTMSRVIRGQVLSLKALPFMEAARAMGVPVRWQFVRHLLPNLLGPIIVYATLTVPQAILQESFLSFLGIGVKPPLPSWGNLAADGLSQLNVVSMRWWLIVLPCVMLGLTLLALNFVGEGLREAFDPRRSKK